jgi:hypothetical protein
LGNRTGIKPTFQKPTFYDMANRVFISNLLVGSLRTFNLNYTVTDATTLKQHNRVWNYFQQCFNGLEQTMGKIPNVSGWVAFYQNPSFHEYWINSSTTQKRFDFLNRLLTVTILHNSLTTRIEVDLIGFIQQFDPAICSDPDLLVRNV